MVKMVVSSFYNTLIENEEAIPVSTMLEIERIRKKGIVFSICTNGYYKEVLDYNRDFPFIDYIVSLNGSITYDVVKERILSKIKLTKTTIKKINELFSNNKIKYYSETKVLKKVKDEDIYKIEKEIKEEEYLEKIDKLNINTSILEKNNKTYLEITSRKSNMFNGIDGIGLRTGIALKDILVIAGNDSDIPLVKNIDKCLVVKNAPKSLKKYVKKQTNSNDNKGVERVLKKL